MAPNFSQSRRNSDQRGNKALCGWSRVPRNVGGPPVTSPDGVVLPSTHFWGSFQGGKEPKFLLGERLSSVHVVLLQQPWAELVHHHQRPGAHCAFSFLAGKIRTSFWDPRQRRIYLRVFWVGVGISSGMAVPDVLSSTTQTPRYNSWESPKFASVAKSSGCSQLPGQEKW